MYILQISALCILQTILQINYRPYYRSITEHITELLQILRLICQGFQSPAGIYLRKGGYRSEWTIVG